MKIEDLVINQKPDGGFGRFHSMSTNDDLTTEKALRRFLFLKLDKDYPIVKKCLEYLTKCLNKELIIPDRREKVINWNVFEELMFSSWLNIFQVQNEKVTQVQNKWASIIDKSIINNAFNIEVYKKQYRLVFGKEGLREINPTSFYMVSLLPEKLSPNVKQPYFHHIMTHGIYYIYNSNLYELPSLFDSKTTIAYLHAIKLASKYVSTKADLKFVITWLNENKLPNGYWMINNIKPDGIIFPQCGSWRRLENKIKDINEFINDVIINL